MSKRSSQKDSSSSKKIESARGAKKAARSIKAGRFGSVTIKAMTPGQIAATVLRIVTTAVAQPGESAADVDTTQTFVQIMSLGSFKSLRDTCVPKINQACAARIVLDDPFIQSHFNKSISQFCTDVTRLVIGSHKSRKPSAKSG